MKTTIICITFAALLTILGCGNGKVGLGGKVTFTDGTPLTVGEVCFETATFMARGTLKGDGSYVVGSISDRDGLPKGTYRVYIYGADRLIQGPPGAGMIPESLIDEKYRNSETSGLTVTVPVPGGKFDFTVEPNPNAKKQ